MKQILIRTFGGGSTGYGHFFRCLSLAKALRKTKDIKIIFLINSSLIELVKKENFEYLVSNSLQDDIELISNLELDLFILDTYLGDDGYLKSIKKKAKIMLIDDNNDIYDSTLVDIIYNGNIHAEKLNYPYKENQIRLLGTKYLIMKEEYWEDEAIDINEKEGILITTGGSDEYKIAINIMNEIKGLNLPIRMIIGPGYEKEYIKKIEQEINRNIELIYSPSSLKGYIKKSKIVITACGSTIYEVLFQKSIPIIFSLADNQDLICRELKDKETLYIGKNHNMNYSSLIDIIKNINNNKVKNEEVFNLIDGQGALRISNLILQKI